MADILHLASEHHLESSYNLNQAFKNDVHIGLQKKHKKIPSKYLYDEQGCHLYNKITRHPDYYLTRCELEILNSYKKDISQKIRQEPFNLIELGPGEGIKTQILIEQFLRDSLNFIYTPIDISQSYLITLTNQFKMNAPRLQAQGIHADYMTGLSWIRKNSTRKNLVLFLGSTIGNFDTQETKNFLHHLYTNLNHGDHVLIGFDLCKDIEILKRAYNDTDGITRDFNLNILQRMNRELGACFILEKFKHYPLYNPKTHSMESYIISLEDQVIPFDSLNTAFSLKAFDAIHLEYSRKFQLAQLNNLATQSGFRIIENYLDKQKYFASSLWRVE